MGTRHVLSNITYIKDNPWLELWQRAQRRAGYEPELLSRASVGRARGGSDAIHLHWPETCLSAPSAVSAAARMVKLLLLCLVGRLRGLPVLLTAHNLTSHDARHPRLEPVLWTVLSRLVTDVHLFSAAGEAEVVRAHPGLRHARTHVVLHGDYLPCVHVDPAVAAASGRSAADPATLLCFGSIRRYKGVLELVEHAAELPPGWQLVVAGSCRDDRLHEELTRAAAASGRVVLELGFLQHDDLVSRIRSADAVVLPYNEVLNSGSALLALTLGRQVHLPDSPTFRELGSEVGQGWVHLYDPRPTIGTLRLSPDPDRPPAMQARHWDRIDEQVRALLATAVASRAAGGRLLRRR